MMTDFITPEQRLNGLLMNEFEFTECLLKKRERMAKVRKRKQCKDMTNYYPFVCGSLHGV